MQDSYRKNFSKIRRIVIKIGTNILTQNTDTLDFEFLKSLARQVSCLSLENKEITIVTSGAIKCGKEKLKIPPRTLQEKQAASAVGQPYLMQHYIDAFGKFNISVGQILLTRDDIADRRRYLNARATFQSLFKYKVIPIVNENDTVATEEIVEMRFGDNDTLAALVGALIGAQLLIILSDVDGLYTSDPKKSKDATLCEVVENITDDIFKSAGGKGREYSIGGMRTKIISSKIATSSGMYVVIASGFRKNVILDIMAGKKIGTLFLPAKNILSSRKCWIAFCKNVSGKIYVNDGAKKMLKNHKSLLPAGIIKVEGNFSAQDNVSLVDENNREFARGLTNYSSCDIKKIAGFSSCEIQKKLGYSMGDEVIHCDNLAVLE